MDVRIRNYRADRPTLVRTGISRNGRAYENLFSVLDKDIDGRIQEFHDEDLLKICIHCVIRMVRTYSHPHIQAAYVLSSLSIFVALSSIFRMLSKSLRRETFQL